MTLRPMERQTALMAGTCGLIEKSTVSSSIICKGKAQHWRVRHAFEHAHRKLTFAALRSLEVGKFTSHALIINPSLDEASKRHEG